MKSLNELKKIEREFSKLEEGQEWDKIEKKEKELGMTIDKLRDEIYERNKY